VNPENKGDYARLLSYNVVMLCVHCSSMLYTNKATRWGFYNVEDRISVGFGIGIFVSRHYAIIVDFIFDFSIWVW